MQYKDMKEHARESSTRRFFQSLPPEIQCSLRESGADLHTVEALHRRVQAMECFQELGLRTGFPPFDPRYIRP